MITLVFLDKELKFDKSLLIDIPYFDNIFKGNYQESTTKKININYNSDDFLSFLSYKFILKSNDNKNKEKKILELCDYYIMEDLKVKYLEFHGLDYLYEKDIIDKEEYIFELIMKENNEIYFDDEKHFNKFYNDPINCKYYNNNNSNNKNNILFYLVFEKYNLIEKAIDYGLFDIIKYDTKLSFYHKSEFKKKYIINDKNYCKNINIFHFACLYSKYYSSNKIIELLINKFKINIQYNENFMKYMIINSKLYSSCITIKLILNKLNNNNKKCITKILILAIKYYNQYKSDKCIETILGFSNIDINSKKNNPLILASINTNFNIIKLIINHPNFDLKKQSYLLNIHNIINENKKYCKSIIKGLINISSPKKVFEYFDTDPLTQCIKKRIELIDNLICYYNEYNCSDEKNFNNYDYNNYNSNNDDDNYDKKISNYNKDIELYEKIIYIIISCKKFNVNDYDNIFSNIDIVYNNLLHDNEYIHYSIDNYEELYDSWDHIFDSIINKSKYDINKISKKGHTLLYNVIKYLNKESKLYKYTTATEILKIILDNYKLDVNIKNKNKRTPLMEVLYNININSLTFNNEIKNILSVLECVYVNVDINIQDNKGMTLLMYILTITNKNNKNNKNNNTIKCKNKKVLDEIIEIIINYSDIDLEIKNNKGESSLSIAKKYNIKINND